MSEDGWIDHDGNGMPVDQFELVTVKFRGGEVFDLPLEARCWHSNVAMHSNWCFTHGAPESMHDIIAYRVVKP